MHKNIMKAIIVLILCLSTAYAFDSLRDIKKYTEDALKKTDDFIKDNGLSAKQERPTAESDDVIVVYKDRVISYNGQKLVLGEHIDKWIKVLGGNYRVRGFKNKHTKNKLIKRSYIWDDLGIGITMLKGDKFIEGTGAKEVTELVKSVNIQFITYLEMFPRFVGKNYDVRNSGGFVSEFYFKGLVEIEDGYLSRETTLEEFKESEVSTKFKTTFSRPGTYSMFYVKGRKFIKGQDEYADQFNIISLTYEDKIKRLSIY